MRAIAKLRAPFLWIVAPFATGLSANECWGLPIPGWVLGLGAVLAAVGALRCHANEKIRSGLLLLSVLGSGWLYGEARRDPRPDWADLPPRDARLTVEVERLFPHPDQPRKHAGIGRVREAPSTLPGLVGQRIYFAYTTRRIDNAPIRSEHRVMRGLLAGLPREPAPDSFDGYLALNGIHCKLTRGRDVERAVPATTYRQFCARLQQRLGRILDYGLAPYPRLAAVYTAMVLGFQERLAPEQEETFMRVGTLHLFSISGLHIGVIALAIGSMLGFLRLPERVNYIATLGLVWLYVDLTGTEPSAVRSFLMIACLFAAHVLRAPRSTLSALVASALLVLLLDPRQLFGAGFQMSYATVAALLVFGVPLAEAWQERWPLFAALPVASWPWHYRLLTAAWRGLLSTLALGLAALLVNSLTSIAYFGLATPGSFFANLVVIPLSSLALLSGMASMIVGLCGLTSLSLLFNYGATLVLGLIDHGSTWFARLPGVAWPAHFAQPWIGRLAFAGLLGVLLLGAAGGWKQRWGGYWVPLAYAAGCLIFLVQFSAAS